jgi:phosphoribosylanthranilate isomerase
MTVALKICGLKTQADVTSAIDAGASFVGFVHFAASPRHITPQDAGLLALTLPEHVRAVSVVVDPDDALLAQIHSHLKHAYVQLHGNETPQRVADIKRLYPDMHIIKAFRVRNGDDIAASRGFADVADMFLFDAKPPELPGALPGGNGLSFDWALLQGREFTLPWMLSGGLNTQNVAEALRLTGAKMVDVSSGVERAPGVKDAALIEAFAEAVRAYD